MSDSSISIWPESLPVPLVKPTHGHSPRGEVTVMDSKRIRVRRNFDTVLETVDVEWNFTKDQFEDFKEYFETDLENGSLLFQFVTYEPTDDVEFLTEITWTAAFWEGSYSFSHSDNLYTVSSTLEVTNRVEATVETPDPLLPPYIPSHSPTLTPVYPTSCRDEVQFEIEMAAGDEYSLQIGESSGGPWHDHVFVKLENPEEVAAGKKTVRLNNDYRGQYYFRVVRTDNAKLVYKPILPQASVIEPPTISITGVDDVAPLRPMWIWAEVFVYGFS